MKTILFDVSLEDEKAILAIANRACENAKTGMPQFNKLGLMMDLKACHSNGCSLKLVELLSAENFDFYHDLMGIERFLNRETGKLEGNFIPRSSKQ